MLNGADNDDVVASDLTFSDSIAEGVHFDVQSSLASSLFIAISTGHHSFSHTSLTSRLNTAIFAARTLRRPLSPTVDFYTAISASMQSVARLSLTELT